MDDNDSEYDEIDSEYDEIDSEYDEVEGKYLHSNPMLENYIIPIEITECLVKRIDEMKNLEFYNWFNNISNNFLEKSTPIFRSFTLDYKRRHWNGQMKAWIKNSSNLKKALSNETGNGKFKKGFFFHFFKSSSDNFPFLAKTP